MLNTLETYLTDTLRTALPEGITLTAGPVLPLPSTQQLPLLNIAAIALQPRPTDNKENRKREPAFFTQRLTFNGNSQILDFTLPAEAVGEIVEVGLEPGRLARHGDDYWLEENTVKFYQAPAGAFTVLVKGAQASGYRELMPCRTTVEIHAWAGKMTQADDCLNPALAATLTALADVDRLELAWLETSGFSLRLLKPQAGIRALERTAVAGDQPVFRSTARLHLQGEWELTLALGTPPKEGLITEVKSHVQVKNSRKAFR